MSLVITLALGLLVFLILGAVLWVLCQVEPWPWVEQASCGRCQHSVEGTATFICPKCGSDFRAVGIHTPDARARDVRTAAVVFGWSLAVVLVSFIVIDELIWEVPARSINFDHDRYVVWSHRDGYIDYMVMLNALSWWEEFMDAVSGRLMLVLSGPETSETLSVFEVADYGDLPLRGEIAVMTIDLASQEWMRDWGDGPRRGTVAELDETFMDQWMTRVEADLEGYERSEANQALCYIVRELSSGRLSRAPDREPWNSIGFINRDYERNSQLGRRIGLDALCLLIWGAGVARIVRGRWRLRSAESSVI